MRHDHGLRSFRNSSAESGVVSSILAFAMSILLPCRHGSVFRKNAGDTEMSRVSILLESSQPRKLQKKER
jgi:hypothetical protein